jgi:aladin
MEALSSTCAQGLCRVAFSFRNSLVVWSRLVGGKIDSLVWDSSSTRVAITYKPSSAQGEEAGLLVAVFTVAWKPYLIFTRSGLIRGPQNSGVPRQVAFAATFEKGALLSIAWSSGLITFHPFYLDNQ